MDFFKDTMKKAVKSAVDMVTSMEEGDELFTTETFVKRNTAENKLIVEEQISFPIGTFNVLDLEGNKKYKIKKKMLSMHGGLCLYDLKGREIGRVQDEDPQSELKKDYSLYYKNRVVGHIRKKFLLKLKLDVDFYGWTVTRTALGNSLEICDENNQQIASIYQDLDRKNSYALAYADLGDEVGGLLILMTVILVNDNIERGIGSDGELW